VPWGRGEASRLGKEEAILPNTQEETIHQVREGGCSSTEVGNHPSREGAHLSREGGEPVHQGRGGGPHWERRPFIKGRRRPFHLTHRRRPFVNGGAQSSVSVMTSDMLWHSITGPIPWDIEFVLSTSPIQYMFCNEFNDIKWMNSLREFSMELLYLLFQKCETSLFSLPNVAVWRDWIISFQPHHVWTWFAGGLYLEFKFQSIYGSRNFICGPCAEITSKIGTLTWLMGSN